MTVDSFDLSVLRSDSEADIGGNQIQVFQQESSPLSQMLRLVPRLFALTSRFCHPSFHSLQDKGNVQKSPRVDQTEMHQFLCNCDFNDEQSYKVLARSTMATLQDLVYPIKTPINHCRGNSLQRDVVIFFLSLPAHLASHFVASQGSHCFSFGDISSESSQPFNGLAFLSTPLVSWSQMCCRCKGGFCHLQKSVGWRFLDNFA